MMSLIVLGLWLGLSPSVWAERIKDVATVAGVRDNQLVGYGLVVGLDGDGDGSAFTEQSLRTMLVQLGVRIPEGVALRSRNVAAVALHATLPPFAKPGQRIDITVSTIGDAKSLRGGSLLVSPLKGLDGQIYAMAQGNLVVGGFGASSNTGNRVTVNVPTVGRVPNGGLVERSSPTRLGDTGEITFQLHRPDFTTAHRLAQAVNAHLGGTVAVALDAISIRVRAPHDPASQVQFLAHLENLSLEPGESPARVIVNARTGTVVISRHVLVKAAAVAHGNLSVTVSNTTQVSQPAALSSGQSVVVPNADV
ncbi:MAG: flagellar basal body P-ring protein FlgI, partial [Gammaproteobacteria bacterium]|nr:flagellar basal body P-ring protein FlgI [Gammaproteobacteria bacterium]